MPSIAVVSSLYGDHDNVSVWPEQTVEYDRFLVTDRTETVPGVKSLYEPRPHMHPRMAAKIAKCMPWLYTDAELIIWVDASIQVTEPRFVEHMISHRDASAPISHFKHPMRDCLVDEEVASNWMAKYQGQDILSQVNTYLHEGMPRHYGLWATGWAVWDMFHPDAKRFGMAWLVEQNRWTYQDQISEPYVSWKHGISIGTIPGDIFYPPYCTLHPHKTDL